MTQTVSNTSRTLLLKLIPFAIIMFLMLIFPSLSPARPASAALLSAEGTRLYRVGVTSMYQNLTSSYYGTQSVSLNATESLGYQAVLSWN
ncbi:MAG: hypothetical protein Q6361_04885, partial [Candidatus Hermodarchaeota archaeon]|nr:hypothetical protein [Candidatus Hermodarchaeota archaeon]